MKRCSKCQIQKGTWATYCAECSAAASSWVPTCDLWLDPAPRTLTAAAADVRVRVEALEEHADDQARLVARLSARNGLVREVADYLLTEADDMREDLDRDEQWRMMDWCRDLILFALDGRVDDLRRAFKGEDEAVTR